jgi:hypothetical protein
MYRLASEAGFQAGLRVWIVFLVVFWILGTRAEISIFLGAIAGLAVRTIVAYSKAQKVPEDVSIPAPVPSDNLFTRVGDRLVGRIRRPGEKQNPAASEPDNDALSPGLPPRSEFSLKRKRRSRWFTAKPPRRIGD